MVIKANVVARATAAKMFTEQPERLAAAWRRERFTQSGRSEVPANLLDGCVEDLVRQIGHTLLGEKEPAWARTKGVLRISVVRGTRALYEEFGALRRCLLDALHVVDADVRDQTIVVREIDVAVDSAIAYCRALEDPELSWPSVPFGGLIVELIDPQPRQHAADSRQLAALQ